MLVLTTVTRLEDSTEADPFAEADECMALQSLIDKTVGPEQSYSADEYLHGDDDLPFCIDLDDKK